MFKYLFLKSIRFLRKNGFGLSRVLTNQLIVQKLVSIINCLSAKI